MELGLFKDLPRAEMLRQQIAAQENQRRIVCLREQEASITEKIGIARGMDTDHITVDFELYPEISEVLKSMGYVIGKRNQMGNCSILW